VKQKLEQVLRLNRHSLETHGMSSVDVIQAHSMACNQSWLLLAAIASSRSMFRNATVCQHQNALPNLTFDTEKPDL